MPPHQRPAIGPERRRRDAAGRRAELLAAALDLFARRDFARVTVRQLARACGVNVSLVYYYFGSKDALFRAAIAHAIEAALDRYRGLGTGDPIAALDAWFDINVELQEPLAKFAKVVIDYRFSPAGVDALDRTIERYYREERRLLAASIEEGMRRGFFRRVDPAEVAWLVQTGLDGAFFGAMTRSSADLTRGIERLRAMVWDHLGCAAGRRHPTPRSR